MNARRKFQVFLILLLAVVTMAILFATGSLRFGAAGPFVYVVYVMAGLLSACLTFGVLSSHGELQGERDGIGLKLGGAVVALVVVTAGGGLYERYLYTPPHFDLLFLFFVENPTKPEPVTGKLVVVVGNQDLAADLDGTGRVLIRSVSSRYLQKPFQIQLKSPNYEIVSNSPSLLPADAPIMVKVGWKQTWESPKTAQISAFFESGFAVDYAPRPDQKNINLVIKVTSESALPVPLSKRATVHLLSNDGVPVESWKFDVVAERAVISPRSITELHVDGMIPKDSYLRITGGRMLSISLAYDSDIEKSTVAFQTLPFSVDDSNFKDLARENR